MTHNVGTIQTAAPAFTIGPDTGTAPSGPNTWSGSFASVPAPTGTKFLILHFTAVSLPASNRLEVDLGYDTDVFTSADGTDFWTRPVNVYALAGGLVPIGISPMVRPPGLRPWTFTAAANGCPASRTPARSPTATRS